VKNKVIGLVFLFLFSWALSSQEVQEPQENPEIEETLEEANPPQSPDIVWTLDWDLTASLLWGMNLDTLASGFENRWEIDFSWTANKGRESADLPYGFVEIADLKFQSFAGPGSLTLTPQYDPEEPFAVNGGLFALDYGEVRAGIGYENWVLDFYGIPEMEVNNSKLVSSVSAGLVSSRMNLSPLVNGGFSLAYETPELVYSFGVASKYSWLDVPAVPGNDFALTWTDDEGDVQYLPLPPSDPGSFSNIDNEYVLNMDLLLYPDPSFFFEVSGLAAVTYTQPEFGGGFLLTPQLSTSTLTLYLPIVSADFIFDKEEKFGWEAGGGFRVRWAGVFDEEVDNVVFGEDIDVFSGFTFGLGLSQYDFGEVLFDMTVSLWEDSGDEGLLPMVGGGISWEGSAIITDLVQVLKAYLDITINGFRPYFGVVAIADNDYFVALFFKPDSDILHFFYEYAGCINDIQASCLNFCDLRIGCSVRAN